jgi:hypothetical protein
LVSGPINGVEPQPTPVHFFAKFLSVLLHAVTRKTIFAAELAVGSYLIANVS